MLLSESMQGFNSRNPFVIRCSYVRHEVDERLMIMTKTLIKSEIVTAIMFVIAILPLVIIPVKAANLQINDLPHAVTAVMLMILNVLSVAVAIIGLVGFITYKKVVIGHSAIPQSNQILQQVREETTLINNEKVLNVTELLNAYLGLIEAFDEFFKLLYSSSIASLVYVLVSLGIAIFAL